MSKEEVAVLVSLRKQAQIFSKRLISKPLELRAFMAARKKSLITFLIGRYLPRLFLELSFLAPLFLLVILFANWYISSVKPVGLVREKLIAREILFWQRAVEIFPGYRDAYLRLAVLNWQIGRGFDAEKFLQAAEKIDPNYGPTKQLRKKL